MMTAWRVREGRLRQWWIAPLSASSVQIHLFSLPWTRRLADRAASEKVGRCLRHVLPLLSLMFSPLEKKHLLGQAGRPRKRGRAPTAGHLATATCVMDAKQKHRRMRATVMRRVLRRFSQVLASFAVNRGGLGARGHRSGPKDKLVGTSRLCLQRGLKRNFTAVDVFDYPVRPTLPTTVA